MKSSAVLKVLILMVVLSSSASAQSDQQQTPHHSDGLFNMLLTYLNEPTAQGGIQIQRMSSTTEALAESEEVSAEASTIYRTNPVYRYPVIKLTDANYTRFAGQHEWIYVKFFTDWCPHSKKVIPAWHEVSYRLSTTPVAVAEIQCEVEGDTLCEKFKVVAYPSFKLIRRGEIRQALIGEIKDVDRLVDEAWKVYLKEGK